MAFIYFDVSGEGAEDLGAYCHILQIESRILVASNFVQYRSADTPKRVMHAGWYNVYADAGSFGTPVVTFHRYQEWETQFDVLTNDEVYAHKLGYQAGPGVTLRIGLTYTT